MRKKEKYIVQSAVIGFVATSLIDILMQWIEHINRDERLTWDSYDGQRTLKNGSIGGVLGAGTGYAVYRFQSSLERKKSFNSDEYLNSILRSENLRENEVLLNNAKILRDKLKLWMVNSFGEKLVCLPENHGSFAKSTANSNSFDIDILLPFKKESFSTLEEMYNWTYVCLEKKFGNNVDVDIYKGTKAICITFEKDGHTISFDVVPGREIENYKIDKKLNLYVNPKKFWKRGTSFKIDSSVQRNITVNKPEARKVIRFLKLYNERNYLGIPSVIIEQAVVEGMSKNNYGIYNSDSDNLLNCMEFIANKLSKSSFIDYGNSNNNLNEKMSYANREKAATILTEDVQRISNDPHYLKEILE